MIPLGVQLQPFALKCSLAHEVLHVVHLSVVTVVVEMGVMMEVMKTAVGNTLRLLKYASSILDPIRIRVLQLHGWKSGDQ
eukprot:CAMPEP_0204442664 /NCGR_PEP_ID=MMETSP0470-20130426/87553_1 /ASSEMBLY_ACC=CAM_ASM_000385 /TAXON_ID=2969 /ORGANISM="Oxyrrhis marina" /LENGTH=79 /DNA_ID=CAMNT_0051441891 /DNA_START=541 /DNA_END=777 /DNA_ORIENTATION=+